MAEPDEPHAHGLLDVGGGARLHWESWGAPEGKPALVLHGGPGSGCSRWDLRGFDLTRWRVVLFDQRGCGRSTPSAADPATDLSGNTTAALVDDVERLRAALGIERWLLCGGSWGSTLLLACAQQHPERVSAAVICGVTTTTRAEIDWLYRGLARFLPGEWERFAAEVGTGAVAAQDHGAVLAAADAGWPATAALLAAYCRLLADPDPAVRLRAARAWHRWEDATIAHERDGTPGAFSDRPDDALVARARLCAHYFAAGAFLEEGALLRGAGRLAGIPAVLLHGRLDLEAPLDTAWQLARAWPGAELTVLDGAGHTPTAALLAAKRTALDRFAARR